MQKKRKRDITDEGQPTALNCEEDRDPMDDTVVQSDAEPKSDSNKVSDSYHARGTGTLNIETSSQLHFRIVKQS